MHKRVPQKEVCSLLGSKNVCGSPPLQNKAQPPWNGLHVSPWFGCSPSLQSCFPHICSSPPRMGTPSTHRKLLKALGQALFLHATTAYVRSSTDAVAQLCSWKPYPLFIPWVTVNHSLIYSQILQWGFPLLCIKSICLSAFPTPVW